MLYILYLLGKKLALTLPLETSYKIAIRTADIYYIFRIKDRKNLSQNLQIALGITDKNEINRHIKQIFRNFAKYLVDFFRFSMIDPEYIKNNIGVEGREHIDRALLYNKGVIGLTAHIGNWELGAAVIACLGYPMDVLVLDHADARINNLFVQQRSACNVKPISVAGQLKTCFRVLRNNHVLGIAGDRDFSNTGIDATFFERDACLPKGPANFALKTGAPIVPSFLVRTADDKFRLIFEEPIQPKHTGNKNDDIKNTMRGYLSVIEKYVRSFPEQWYSFNRVWD